MVQIHETFALQKVMARQVLQQSGVRTPASAHTCRSQACPKQQKMQVGTLSPNLLAQAKIRIIRRVLLHCLNRRKGLALSIRQTASRMQEQSSTPRASGVSTHSQPRVRSVTGSSVGRQAVVETCRGCGNASWCWRTPPWSAVDPSTAMGEGGDFNCESLCFWCLVDLKLMFQHHRAVGPST